MALTDPLTSTNLFLRSLSEADLESLAPYLTRRQLVLGKVLAEQGDALSVIHFVETGIISCVMPMRDGQAVEACMIGNEGFTALEACYRPAVSSTRLLVQAAGYALTIDAEIFRRLLRTSEAMQAAVADYDWRQRAEIEQTAACNVAHAAEQRLAKWLLRSHDRHNGAVMLLTQANLATMLGMQRTTVNQIAQTLSASGAISYSRGKVAVKNRALLERSTCECYAPSLATRDNRVTPMPPADRPWSGDHSRHG